MPSPTHPHDLVTAFLRLEHDRGMRIHFRHRLHEGILLWRKIKIWQIDRLMSKAGARRKTCQGGLFFVQDHLGEEAVGNVCST